MYLFSMKMCFQELFNKIIMFQADIQARNDLLLIIKIIRHVI